MKLYTILLLTVIFSTASNAQEKHNVHSVDKPSTHGMLIFGKNKIYAYHLSMFHSPHDYQIILELELEDAAKELFVKDQQSNTEYVTYTIEPEIFVLPQRIVKGNSFTADLYRGHFERGGKNIASKINVTIKDVIVFKKFQSDLKRSSASRFVLFGNEKEQFMAHELTAKPDFDQLIQVKSSIDALLEGKSNVVIDADPAENVPLGVSGNEIEVTLNGIKYPIVLTRQLYLEFGDLK
jgi:hypothetical protein